MTEALLYQPNQKWRIGAAFGAAALIHFAAIAFAGLHLHSRIVEVPSLPPGTTELSFELAPPIDDPTPPPEVLDPPTLPSPLLDNAAAAGFRRWRFKPGTISRVKSPITFTLAGAQY